MHNLFNPVQARDIKARIGQLGPQSRALWGKMNAAQAMAHCAAALEMALGERTPPRMVVGRIIGALIKPLVFKEGEPMRKNVPTLTGFAVEDERNLTLERDRLLVTIDRFQSTGPGGCTRNPHSFFGRLTPEEWAILMYKHLDHHLRQFGV